MAPTKFHQLKVRKAGSTTTPLKLTFTSLDVMHDVETACRKEGFEIVDSSVGYALFQDVESAMKSVRVFCRR